MCCADNVLLLSGFSACVAVLLVPVLLRGQSTRWVTAECREREREAESEQQHTCCVVFVPTLTDVCQSQ